MFEILKKFFENKREYKFKRVKVQTSKRSDGYKKNNKTLKIKVLTYKYLSLIF